MLLASLLTGGRVASDLVHAAKGTTPPHIEKARINAEKKAQQAKATKQRSEYANGKPRLKDVAAVYWGDAMADTIAAHNRKREEKARQRTENADANAEGRPAATVRPSLKDRAKRVWDLLVKPVGESKPAETPADVQAPAPGPKPATAPKSATGTAPTPTPAPATAGGTGATAKTDPDAETLHWKCYRCGMTRFRFPTMAAAQQNLDRHNQGECAARQAENTKRGLTPDGYVRPPATASSNQPNSKGDTMTAATGEAVNYETAMAQLDAIEAAQREHLEHALAALAKVQGAKQDIADTQATYRPAAEAAGATHESLTALNLDAQTVANTGTMADAMPPNEVDSMFSSLEAMEARIKEQVANAEAALAATANARSVIVAKYGDAHATVQGELSGDSRFLGSGGGNVSSAALQSGDAALRPGHTPTEAERKESNNYYRDKAWANSQNR